MRSVFCVVMMFLVAMVQGGASGQVDTWLAEESQCPYCKTCTTCTDGSCTDCTTCTDGNCTTCTDGNCTSPYNSTIIDPEFDALYDLSPIPQGMERIYEQVYLSIVKKNALDEEFEELREAMKEMKSRYYQVRRERSAINRENYRTMRSLPRSQWRHYKALFKRANEQLEIEAILKDIELEDEVVVEVGFL